MTSHNTDLELLLAATESAAELALTEFGRHNKSWHKQDGSGLVTEMDLKVDAILREQLLAARPNYGWLSEESADTPDRLQRERVFVVDPIDGTTFYAQGQPDFGISVAIVADGKPETAVLRIPARGECYSADRQNGARCNGTLLLPGADTALDGAKVIVRKSMLKPNKWSDPPPSLRPQRLVPLAYRFCKVAAGYTDATMTLWSAWEWDIAAGDLIAQMAGLRTTDIAGNPLRYNAVQPRVNGLVVARPLLHAEILARLHPEMKPPI